MKPEQKICAMCAKCDFIIDFNNNTSHHECSFSNEFVNPKWSACHKFMPKPKPYTVEDPETSTDLDETWEERRFQLVKGMVIAYYSNPVAPSEIPIDRMIEMANKIITRLQLEANKK